METNEKISKSKLSKEKAGTSFWLKSVLLFSAFMMMFVGLDRLEIFENFKSPGWQLERHWKRDFLKLKNSGALSPGFKRIKKVEYIATTKGLKEFLIRYGAPPFDVKAEGQNILEIFMDELDTCGVVIQYDLIDSKGNTIFELGRTYNLSGKSFSN